ncbi:hypothetical protein ACWDAZ_38100, partial [Streptomyces sp. NPDC001215]
MKRFDDADFGLTWLTTMFHADWTHNGTTGAEAVRYHLDPDLEPEAVLAIRRDAQSLLDNLDTATIETLCRQLRRVGQLRLEDLRHRPALRVVRAEITGDQ